MRIFFFFDVFPLKQSCSRNTNTTTAANNNNNNITMSADNQEKSHEKMDIDSNNPAQDEEVAVEEEEEDDQDVEKIKILPGASEDGTAASFQIIEEDHTLGNALKLMIMKNPEVEFCGYSIPHPSEPKLHLRIQTYGNITAVEALHKGLDDLASLCTVVEEKFSQSVALNNYKTVIS